MVAPGGGPCPVHRARGARNPAAGPLAFGRYDAHPVRRGGPVFDSLLQAFSGPGSAFMYAILPYRLDLPWRSSAPSSAGVAPCRRGRCTRKIRVGRSRRGTQPCGRASGRAVDRGRRWRERRGCGVGSHGIRSCAHRAGRPPADSLSRDRREHLDDAGPAGHGVWAHPCVHGAGRRECGRASAEAVRGHRDGDEHDRLRTAGGNPPRCAACLPRGAGEPRPAFCEAVAGRVAAARRAD